MRALNKAICLTGMVLAAGAMANEVKIDAGFWGRHYADVPEQRIGLLAMNRDWDAIDSRVSQMAQANVSGPGSAASTAHGGGDHYLRCPKCSAVAPASLFVAATAGGVAVGVAHQFSTWSDLTAVFRPSRWGSPLAAGGTLSWMNYKAWRDAPGRTGKVLLGELVVIGAGYALYEATRDDKDDDRDAAPAAAPAPDPAPAPSSTPAPNGSAPPPPPPPPPPPIDDGGGEKPW